MDSHEIEVFLQIVRHRSLTRAAEATHLAQSTVTKRLQLLEDSLGYTLIERGKGIKRLELTPRGAAFVRIAERWQELTRQAVQLRQMQTRYSLAIGTVPSANMTFIPQLSRRLAKHSPEISFRIVSLHSVEMYDEIEKRTIDVGFTLVEQVSQNVTVTPSFSVPMLGIRIKQPRARKSVDVQSLDPKQCIYFPWGTRYQTWHDYWFHAGESPKICIDNPYILLSLLEHREQWAIVPQGIANILLASGKFQTFQVRPQPPDRVFFKLEHKRPRASTQYPLGIFNEYLRDELNNSYIEVYNIL